MDWNFVGLDDGFVEKHRFLYIIESETNSLVDEVGMSSLDDV